MTAEKLQHLMYGHTKAMLDLTERYMARKGDKAENCQRMTVLNSLKQTETCINGIKDEDIKPGRPD